MIMDLMVPGNLCIFAQVTKILLVYICSRQASVHDLATFHIRLHNNCLLKNALSQTEMKHCQHTDPPLERSASTQAMIEAVRRSQKIYAYTG